MLYNNSMIFGKLVANRAEIVSTLTTLASALSVTADLPTADELQRYNTSGQDSDAYLDSRINVTLIRVLNALKLREDAS